MPSPDHYQNALALFNRQVAARGMLPMEYHHQEEATTLVSSGDAAESARATACYDTDSVGTTAYNTVTEFFDTLSSPTSSPTSRTSAFLIFSGHGSGADRVAAQPHFSAPAKRSSMDAGRWGWGEAGPCDSSSSQTALLFDDPPGGACGVTLSGMGPEGDGCGNIRCLDTLSFVGQHQSQTGCHQVSSAMNGEAVSRSAVREARTTPPQRPAKDSLPLTEMVCTADTARGSLRVGAHGDMSLPLRDVVEGIPSFHSAHESAAAPVLLEEARHCIPSSASVRPTGAIRQSLSGLPSSPATSFTGARTSARRSSASGRVSLVSSTGTSARCGTSSAVPKRTCLPVGPGFGVEAPRLCNEKERDDDQMLTFGGARPGAFGSFPSHTMDLPERPHCIPQNVQRPTAQNSSRSTAQTKTVLVDQLIHQLQQERPQGSEVGHSSSLSPPQPSSRTSSFQHLPSFSGLSTRSPAAPATPVGQSKSEGCTPSVGSDGQREDAIYAHVRCVIHRLEQAHLGSGSYTTTVLCGTTPMTSRSVPTRVASSPRSGTEVEAKALVKEATAHPIVTGGPSPVRANPHHMTPLNAGRGRGSTTHAAGKGTEKTGHSNKPGHAAPLPVRSPTRCSTGNPMNRSRSRVSATSQRVIESEGKPVSSSESLPRNDKAGRGDTRAIHRIPIPKRLAYTLLHHASLQESVRHAARLVIYVLMSSLPAALYRGDTQDYQLLSEMREDMVVAALERAVGNVVTETNEWEVPPSRSAPSCCTSIGRLSSARAVSADTPTDACGGDQRVSVSLLPASCASYRSVPSTIRARDGPHGFATAPSSACRGSVPSGKASPPICFASDCAKLLHACRQRSKRTSRLNGDGGMTPPREAVSPVDGYRFPFECHIPSRKEEARVVNDDIKMCRRDTAQVTAVLKPFDDPLPAPDGDECRTSSDGLRGRSTVNRCSVRSMSNTALQGCGDSACRAPYRGQKPACPGFASVSRRRTHASASHHSGQSSGPTCERAVRAEVATVGVLDDQREAYDVLRGLLRTYPFFLPCLLRLLQEAYMQDGVDDRKRIATLRAALSLLADADLPPEVDAAGRPNCLSPPLVMSHGGYGAAPFSGALHCYLGTHREWAEYWENDRHTVCGCCDHHALYIWQLMRTEPTLLPLGALTRLLHNCARQTVAIPYHLAALSVGSVEMRLLMELMESYSALVLSLCHVSGTSADAVRPASAGTLQARGAHFGSEDSSMQGSPAFVAMHRDVLMEWSCAVICEAAIGYAMEMAGDGLARFQLTTYDSTATLTDDQIDQLLESPVSSLTLPCVPFSRENRSVAYSVVEHDRSVVTEALTRVKGELFYLLTGVDQRDDLLEMHYDALHRVKDAALLQMAGAIGREGDVGGNEKVTHLRGGVPRSRSGVDHLRAEEEARPFVGRASVTGARTYPPPAAHPHLLPNKLMSSAMTVMIAEEEEVGICKGVRLGNDDGVAGRHDAELSSIYTASCTHPPSPRAPLAEAIHGGQQPADVFLEANVASPFGSKSLHEVTDPRMRSALDRYAATLPFASTGVTPVASHLSPPGVSDGPEVSSTPSTDTKNGTRGPPSLITVQPPPPPPDDTYAAPSPLALSAVFRVMQVLNDERVTNIRTNSLLCGALYDGGVIPADGAGGGLRGSRVMAASASATGTSGVSYSGKRQCSTAFDILTGRRAFKERARSLCTAAGGPAAPELTDNTSPTGVCKPNVSKSPGLFKRGSGGSLQCVPWMPKSQLHSINGVSEARRLRASRCSNNSSNPRSFVCEEAGHPPGCQHPTRQGHFGPAQAGHTLPSGSAASHLPPRLASPCAHLILDDYPEEEEMGMRASPANSQMDRRLCSASSDAKQKQLLCSDVPSPRAPSTAHGTKRECLRHAKRSRPIAWYSHGAVHSRRSQFTHGPHQPRASSTFDIHSLSPLIAVGACIDMPSGEELVSDRRATGVPSTADTLHLNPFVSSLPYALHQPAAAIKWKGSGRLTAAHCSPEKPRDSRITLRNRGWRMGKHVMSWTQ